MHTNTPLRSYTIKNNTFYFYAGHLGNGHQALMGIQAPECVLVEFDSEGNYLSLTVRKVLDPPHVLPDRAVDSEAALLTALQDWQKASGFQSATIFVKSFFLPERWIGITDLPEHYQEVLDNPENFDEERRIALQEDIRQWRDAGDFVLYWVEDYYLDQDGEVSSS